MNTMFHACHLTLKVRAAKIILTITGTGSAIVRTPDIAQREPTIFPQRVTGFMSP